MFLAVVLKYVFIFFQSLSRGSFLRNERPVEEERPSSVAVSESVQLRQHHTVSGLRGGKMGGRVSMNQVGDGPKVQKMDSTNNYGVVLVQELNDDDHTQLGQHRSACCGSFINNFWSLNSVKLVNFLQIWSSGSIQVGP